MQVQGKVIAVTGGGSGIGRATVHELLRRGARVAVVDRNEDGVRQTITSTGAGDRATGYTVDVTDRAAVHALPERVIADFGVVDGVVHVAGIIQPPLPFVDLDEDAARRVIDVNWWGTYHVAKAFLPRLLERPEAQLVNVSSMGGFLPTPGLSVYGAAKAGVKILTEALRAELAGSSVVTTVVFPGAVATDLGRNSGLDVPEGFESPPGFASPEQAAAGLVDGMERGDFQVFVGEDAVGADAFYRSAPEAAAKAVGEQMAAMFAKA